MHISFRAAAFLAVFGVIGSASAETIKSPIVGLWKVSSFSIKTASNQVMATMGDHPGGYILYSKNGHFLLFYSGGNRPAYSPPTSDADAGKLLATMAAVDGTYKLSGKNQIMVHVEDSWNQSLVGTDAPRNFSVSGKKLTVTFAVKGANGQDVTVTVNSERAE